jgi:putative peptidoglycan lipid II flippase
MFASVRTLLIGGLVGKLLGVVRELTSASLFGTGLIASAYRLSQAAFVIPLNGLLAESLSSGFTPTYARRRVQESTDTRAIFAGMLAVLVAFSVVVACVVGIFAAAWVRILAPGFNAHAVTITSQMVQVMACAMPPFALTSLCAAAELATGKAEMAAARASIQSVGLICGTATAWLLDSPILIPVGFVVAYLWLAVWGVKSALSANLRLWPSIDDWRAARPGLFEIWRAFRIVLWLPILMQVHFVVERRVASIVSANAVAALDYARFVSETAVLLLAMPFGMAGLAAMSHMDEHRYRQAALRSFRVLLFIGIPLSAATSINAEWIVRMIFARGAFGPSSVHTTAVILRGFAAGIWAQLLGYAGGKFLSARGDNAALVLIYILSLSCNIALNLLLHNAVGVAVLGTASALANLCLGVLMIMRLGLLTVVYMDVIVLILTTLGYLALVTVMPPQIALISWIPPVIFIVYWIFMGIAVRRCRVAVVEMWGLVRHASPS